MRRPATLLVLAAIALAAPAAADVRELAEVPRTMAQLPQSVARTLQRWLDGREAEEIEEILYEGVPVLYEAELTENGREVEIAIRPDGEAVAPGEAQRDDDDDEEEGEDDDRDDELSEREVTVDDLPDAAAAVVRRIMRRVEIEEIEAVRYEGITVLYELELDDDDRRALYVYPDGAVAEREGDVVERELSLDDVPGIVADALRRHLGAARIEEIEEVRYEGVVVLYEAESDDLEVAVYPDGTLADRHRERDDDDDDD